MYKLFYGETLLGTVTANHSMSVEDCINSLEIDIYAVDEEGNELYPDYEMFRIEVL